MFLLVRLWLRCLPLTSSTALRLLPITAGMPCVLPNARWLLPGGEEATGPVGADKTGLEVAQELRIPWVSSGTQVPTSMNHSVGKLPFLSLSRVAGHAQDKSSIHFLSTLSSSWKEMRGFVVKTLHGRVSPSKLCIRPFLFNLTHFLPISQSFGNGCSLLVLL